MLRKMVVALLIVLSFSFVLARPHDTGGRVGGKGGGVYRSL
jgi:hypothetical protein